MNARELLHELWLKRRNVFIDSGCGDLDCCPGYGYLGSEPDVTAGDYVRWDDIEDLLTKLADSGE